MTNPKRIIAAAITFSYRHLFFYLKWRIVCWALGVGFFILAYMVGAIIPLSEEHAANIRKTLAEKNKSLSELAIFANNLVPSLEMFIPAAGVAIGGYAALSTGQVFNAFAVANPALKNVSPLSLLKAPFAIMEITAYSIAMSRSGLVTYYLIRKRQEWKQYVIPTVIEVGIVILILFIGSIIEWQTILQRQNR